MLKYDGTPTRVSGAGMVITEIARTEKPGGGKGFNFLIRTDDNNVVRLQFWEDLPECLFEMLGSNRIKGMRVGFTGELRGTYQEKPTVSTTIDRIRFK